MGFAAINTANNLIYLIVSALLSFMALSGFFGRKNIQGLQVEVETPEEVYASKGFVIALRLENLKRLMPSFLIRLHLQDREVLFPYVEVKGSSIRYLEVRIDKRGLHRFQSLYITSVFPFNFFVRSMRLNTAVELVVFAEPYPCRLGADQDLRQKTLRGGTTSDRIGHEADIISIRNYIYGDPFKYINWKATAKTDSLKTKELSMPINEPVVIDLEQMPYDLETNLRCATYLINALFNAGIPFGLKMGDRLFLAEHSKSHKLKLLREIALYGL